MRSISLRASCASRAPRRALRPATAWTVATTWTLTAAAAAAAAALIAACGGAPPAAPGPGSTGEHVKTATASSSAATTPAAISAGPATPGDTAQAPGGQPCDPRLIGPIGASFVSASDGYLLGISLSGCQASAASRIVLRKTADGGLRWTALPGPPAPWGGVAPDGTGHIPADGVTSVLFADARDGWAYGPGLWATHDGGATWHRVAVAGRAVQSMAVTGGQVLASLESCDPVDAACDGSHVVGVESSPASQDAWRPVPGSAGGAAVIAQAGIGYAVSAGTGQFGTDEKLLTGPADGLARWASRPIPCRQGAVALAAVTAARLLLACAELGAHPATTYLYSSFDAGAHWSRYAVLGLYDGASAIEQAPDGTVLVAGIYNGVELSRDGGRTWAGPAAVDDSDSIQGGGPLAVDLLTSEDGYVIGWLGPLWITRDAGRTWTPVPVH